jgi:hypothetical protein
VRGPNLKYAYSERAHALLAGYVTKDFDTTPRGQRRYFKAQGMKPQVTLFYARNEAEALDLAGNLFDAAPRWKNEHGGAAVYFYPVAAPQAPALAASADLNVAG